MANAFRSALSLSLIFSLIVGAVAPSVSHAQTELAVAAVRSSETLSAAQLLSLESKLVSEIDRQADLIFQDFLKSHPQAPISFLKKAQQQILFRLKQMGVLTEILKASGKAPAVTLIAGEIIPTFILFPMFAAMGQPLAATSMLTVPWGLIGGLGAFSYSMIKVRREMATQLNVASLAQFDKVRELVVGYDIKKRVTSTLVQSLSGEHIEFEILKKAFKSEGANTPAIAIKELETLVRASESGAKYLSYIFMQKLDAATYASLLLRFVKDDAELTSQLASLISSRAQIASTQVSPSFRSYLIASSETQMQIKREIKKINSLKSAVFKQRLKSLNIRGADSKDLRQHLAAESARLQLLLRQLSLAEYSLLIEAKAAVEAKDSGAMKALVSERAERFETLSAEAKFVEYQPSKARVCLDLFAIAM